jgi:hypothetical protein
MKQSNIRILMSAGVCLCLCSLPARAGVLVATTINLTHLQINPASGTFQLVSPFNVGAFAQAQDSLGGFSQQFNSVDDGSTSAVASTSLASASGSASALSLMANSFSGVNIGTAAFASSVGQGALGPAFGTGQGFFEIFDGLNPTPTAVNVNFSATLSINQFLLTDASGVFASSETIFQLILPDLPNQPLLFFDNPITIGPSDSASFISNPTLTGSVTLQTNTQYTLIAEVDSESSGLNTVPEPSLILLDGLGAAMLCAWLRKRNRNKPLHTA